MKFEKKLKIQLACGFLWICLGILACVAAFSGKVSSGYPLTYCAGTGGGLIAIGFIHIIKSIRLLKNESLRKKKKSASMTNEIFSFKSRFTACIVCFHWFCFMWQPFGLLCKNQNF